MALNETVAQRIGQHPADLRVLADLERHVYREPERARAVLPARSWHQQGGAE